MFVYSVLIFLLAIFIDQRASAQLVPGRSPTPAPSRSACDGAVECLIESIVIGPIEFCIDINSNSTQYGLCIWDLICSDMYVAGIESQYLSPHELFLGISDASLNCLGEWNVTSNSSNTVTLLYSGEFSIAVYGLTASTDMTLQNYSSYDIPSNITLSNCSVEPTVDYTIHFLGGAIGKTLDSTLAPKLEQGLEDHTDELFCEVLAPVVEALLEEMLTVRLNPLLEDLIYAGNNPPPPPVINGTYDWRNSKLQTIHILLDMLTVDTERSFGDCLFANNSKLPIVDHDTPIDFQFDINFIIDLLTRGTGVISIPIDQTIIIGNASTSSLSLVLTSAVISGLDTFTNLTLFKPSTESGAVLSSAVGLEALKLQLNMELHAEGGLYVEAFVLTVDLENVLLTMDLVVALSVDALDSIYVDQYLADESCVWEALEELYVSSLGLFADISELSIIQKYGNASSLDQDLVSLIDNFLEWILTGYPMRELLAGLGQTAIKDAINNNLLDRMENNSAACPPHTVTTTVDYIVWNTSSTILALNSLLNDLIGPSGLNAFMTCLTNGTGDLSLTAINSTSGEGLSITLVGMNSFYEFALLYPITREPYDLGNSLAMGQCTSQSCNPFGIRIEGLVGRNRTLYLELDMENIELYIDLLLMLDKNGIGALTLGQVDTDGCLMTAVDALMIFASSLSLSKASLYLDDGNTVKNFTDAIDFILDAVQGKGGLVDRFNSNSEEAIDTAADRCAGTYVPLSDDDNGNGGDSRVGPKSWTWQLALLLVGCSLAMVLLVYLYHYFLEENELEAAKREANSLCSGAGELSVGPDMSMDSQTGRGAVPDNSPSIAKFGKYLAGLLGYADFNYDALVAQTKIPIHVRVLFPVACLSTMGLILLGNLQIGTSVMVELDIGDVKLEPGSIFDFRLSNTVRDMWFAGVYPLSILVAFFSGAWPYIKLFSMFVTWLTPTSLVTAKQRGWVLGWLDILGKWSLIDAYVMVMMMVAFHVELDIAPGISVIVTVLPKKGFNNFLLATMISLGLGHIAMGCHRVVTEGKILAKDRSRESMQNHIFSWKAWVPVSTSASGSTAFSGGAKAGLQGAEETAEISAVSDPSTHHIVEFRKVRFTCFGKITVTAYIIGAMLVVVAGAFLLTFTFHFKGLTGYLLRSESDPNYSLVTTGKAVAQSTGNPDSFDIRWIQAAFFGFGIAMPLGFLFVLLIVWIMPLKLTMFRRLVVLAEVFNAWNAIDVFVLSVAAALLEIEQFAEFIIGDSCEEIDKILKKYFDDMLHGEDTCFDVTATLKTDFWVLCFAACLMLFGGLPMLSVCHQAITDRQITNRTGDTSIKGVTMSQLKDGFSSGHEVQNPLSGLGAAIHDPSLQLTESAIDKPPFWDRATATMVQGLVAARICTFVDDDASAPGDHYVS